MLIVIFKMEGYQSMRTKVGTKDLGKELYNEFMLYLRAR
jgi:hypothetical protein